MLSLIPLNSPQPYTDLSINEKFAGTPPPMDIYSIVDFDHTSPFIDVSSFRFTTNARYLSLDLNNDLLHSTLICSPMIEMIGI